MQSQENTTRAQRRRCRQMAQRIMAELCPKTIWMPCGDSPLAQALSAAGAQVAADPQPVQTQLTVVEDPAWAQVPDALSGPLLLVAADSPLLSSWTDTLAERGYYRDFSWKNRGRTQPAALYRQADVLPAPQALAQGYEQELDSVRENLARAQHQLEEQDAQLQRLRSDLSLSRSHEQAAGKRPGTGHWL